MAIMWWEILLSCITAFSGLLIIFQLFLSHKQKKKEHEEQRRQKTVEIMLEWNASLERETSFAEKIVEQFTQEQCRNLYSQKKFYVNKDLHEQISQICAYKKEGLCETCASKDGTEFCLEGKRLLALTWYIISYLNTLETVLVAWQQETVDKKIIEHEFSYLYSQEKGRNVLAHFREAAGGKKAYPVIDAFINKLKQNEESKNALESKKGL